MDGPPEDFSGIPLPQRLAHKNWKARKDGYETAIKALNTAIDSSDETVQFFLRDPNTLKSAITDANVIAQQDGYGVLCSFLKITEAEGCQRTRPLLAPICAEKGLSASRPITKQKALEALLLFSEMEHPNFVIEDMIPHLSQRVPKNVASVLSALKEVCHAFGCRVVNPKPIAKVLGKAFGHADKNVRAEAQSLAVELVRWTGEGVKGEFWADLKPVQQQELEKLFADRGDPPKPERIIISARAAAEENENEVEDVQEAEDEVYVPDAVSVLDKLPEGLYENLASTKWKERKEALDALCEVLDKPRIEEGPYDDLVRALAKSPKDVNVMVVTVGANCIRNLALSLGTGFSKYRSSVLGLLLERLKEKKASVLESLNGAIDATLACAPLGESLEEVIPFLVHKVPGVRAESGKALIRYLQTTKSAPSIPETKALADAAHKLLGDSQGAQRDTGAQIMGTLAKIMGDRVMAAHLEPLDDIRKGKIKDFQESAEVKAKYKPKPVAPPAAAVPKKVLPGRKMPVKRSAPAAAAPGGPSSVVASSGAVPTLETPVAARVARPLKPGVKSLKKPTFGTKASAGTAPASGSVPSLTSPEEQQPRIGRGLAARPLNRPQLAGEQVAAVPQTPAPASTAPPAIPSLTSAERAELDELRAESDRLRRQNEELRSERGRLLAEVAELQSSAQLAAETHVYELKAKDTQLRRLEAEKGVAEREAERATKELERVRKGVSSATTQPPGTQSGLAAPGFASLNAVSGGGASSGLSSGRSSGLSERGSSISGSSIPTGPNNSSATPRTERLSGYFSPSRPSQLNRLPMPTTSSHSAAGSAMGAGLGSDATVESWKRAAEVTQNLKARIEYMKAKQGRRIP